MPTRRLLTREDFAGFLAAMVIPTWTWDGGAVCSAFIVGRSLILVDNAGAQSLTYRTVAQAREALDDITVSLQDRPDWYAVAAAVPVNREFWPE